MLTIRFATYQDWSAAFTKARKDVGNIDRVLDLWKTKIPGNWADRSWQGKWGYRKSSKKGSENAGEKGIERHLLNENGTLKRMHMIGANKRYSLDMAYHNFPLTNHKKGQVVSDVLGVVFAGNRHRPLLIEVKKTDGGPWHALVECLKQVRLARFSGQRICAHLEKVIHPLEKGAWGLVVAPPGYFGREMTECKDLLNMLKEKTNARIAFATIESQKTELKWILGNWE